MVRSVAHAWIWSVPPPPTTMKSREAIEEQTWRACAGVYWSSWKSVWIFRPQTVCPGWSQKTWAPALNELFGNGVPVPVSGAWMPTLIVPALIPVVLPPCGVPHATLPEATVVLPVDVVPPAVVPPVVVPPGPVTGPPIVPGAPGTPATGPVVLPGPVLGAPGTPGLFAGPTPLAFSDAVASGLRPHALVSTADAARTPARSR